MRSERRHSTAQDGWRGTKKAGRGNASAAQDWLQRPGTEFALDAPVPGAWACIVGRVPRIRDPSCAVSSLTPRSTVLLGLASSVTLLLSVWPSFLYLLWVTSPPAESYRNLPVSDPSAPVDLTGGGGGGGGGAWLLARFFLFLIPPLCPAKTLMKIASRPCRSSAVSSHPYDTSSTYLIGR